VVAGGRASIANVGDSRCYLLRGGVLAQVTVDHSWVAEQVRAGQLAATAVASHPHRSLLTRALTGDPVEVDLFSTAVLPGDLLLVCSDGLWDSLGDEGLRARLAGGGSLDAVAASLCDAALLARPTENVTAVLCRVDAGL
jgi:PPM family protein phosphatase